MVRHKEASSVREEMKYYGVACCLALWTHRPEDVIRVYLTETRLKLLQPLVKWCSRRRKAYHIVSAAQLEKIAESVHHEGVCILAKAPPLPGLDEVLRRLHESSQSREGSTECLVYLDGVENPQNIGSILRACAHFGVRFVLAPRRHLRRLGPSACRVADGAAEFVKVTPLDSPTEAAHSLRPLGYVFIATSSNRGRSVFEFPLPAKSVFVVGSESKGVSEELFKMADETVQVPGTGQVESLNVAVATGVLLSEYWRQHHSK